MNIKATREGTSVMSAIRSVLRPSITLGLAALAGAALVLAPPSATAQVATCGADPMMDCRTPEKSSFALQQKDAGAKDKLTIKMVKGPATTQGEFGDPTSTAGYAVCIYDGTHSTLIFEASVPADAGKWKATGTKGYKYSDKTGDDGVQKIGLSGGADGKTKVLVKGKGPDLADPTLPTAFPVRVQVINSETSVCFEDMYDGSDKKKVEATRVKVKGGPEDPTLPLPVLRSPDPLPSMTAAEAGVAAYVGAPAVAAPLAPLAIPPHPFLDNAGDSRIHNDHYNSAVYNRAGPLGVNPQISTADLLLDPVFDLTNVCAMLTFTEEGNIVGACINANIQTVTANSRLTMLDPVTLDIYADVVTAPRPLIQNSAGGAYFSIDNNGRYVIGPANNAVEIWEQVLNGGQPQFVRLASYDVSTELDPSDLLQDTVIDYDGRLWFVSIQGIIGYFDPATETLETFDMGEDMQNSFAVDATGLYVVTFDAMHKYSVDVDDTVKQDWRVPYDNTGPGILQPGSGTTPTLFGAADDLIGFADTAIPQINMVILDRTTGANVCLTPIFRPNESGAENTFLTYGDEVVVVNNAGFTSAFGPQNTIFPGLEKYTVRVDRTGCDVEWVNDTAFGNSAQMSTVTGLIYGWGADPNELSLDAYYFTAHDWVTGAEVYRVYTGNDLPFNPVTGQAHIGPDGSAYFGSLHGIIRVADGP